MNIRSAEKEETYEEQKSGAKPWGVSKILHIH